MRISVSILLLIASFSVFSEDWDAMGNPMPRPEPTQYPWPPR